MAPTILFVPGFWEGPKVFTPVCDLLRADGFTTEVCTLPSTGTTSPGNPTMADDIAAVRDHLKSILQRGEEVILVLHSAGGFLGSAAMEGLSKSAVGQGGVVKIIFLAGAVYPEGHEHEDLPFAVVEVGYPAYLCSRPYCGGIWLTCELTGRCDVLRKSRGASSQRCPRAREDEVVGYI